MSDRNWQPMFRASSSTVTKVLRSPAFLHSRERSAGIAEDPDELRALAALVETLDHASAPLAMVADRVVAAVRFLRARADHLEVAHGSTGAGVGPAPLTGHASAGVATRERLLIASLHYLVTPVDLVPDFRAGGYIDDVVLLSWVFGIASSELAPYLADDPLADGTAAGET